MRTTLALLLTVAAAGAADAATLRLRDGGSVSVDAPRTSSAAQLPLRYTIVESSGRTWSGDVPGSAGVDSADVALAQSPMTGDAVLVFAVPDAAGHDLAITGWTGQQWAAPEALTSGAGDEVRPALAFRPSGDALVAWTDSDDGSVLLRHFEYAPGSDVSSYAFVRVGPLATALGADRTMGRTPALFRLVGSDALAAYLLVGDAAGAPLGVVKISLDAILDPGGFGAAPVPVSFIRSVAQSAPTTGGGPVAGRMGDGAVGEVFEAWRVVMGTGAAWYWAEATQAALIAFRGGDAGRLVAFGLPASESMLHVDAFRVARAELGMGLRRGVLAGPAGRSRAN